MKKMLLALTLALLSTSAAGVANATHSPSGDDPSQDFAVGGGVDARSHGPFSFVAQSGPSGEDARGHYRISAGVGSGSGEVTCLLTVGNRAVLGGPGEDLPGVPVEISHYFLVEDNGEPGGAVPDRFRAVLALGPADQGGCATFFPLLPQVVSPVERGNITVHDGQPNVVP